MRPKDKEYEQARDLRTRGYSLREISEIVPASKGTISVWVRDIPLSEDQLQRLNDNRVIGRERARATAIQNRQKRIDEYHKLAEAE
jgi:transposase